MHGFEFFAGGVSVIVAAQQFLGPDLAALSVDKVGLTGLDGAAVARIARLQDEPRNMPWLPITERHHDQRRLGSISSYVRASLQPPSSPRRRGPARSPIRVRTRRCWTGVPGWRFRMVLLFHFVADVPPSNWAERVIVGVTDFLSFGVAAVLRPVRLPHHRHLYDAVTNATTSATST